LGTVPYSVALEFQHQLVQDIERNPKSMTILGVEHPSVITLGKRALPQEEIKIELSSLEDLNIQCYKVDRGGHATLHSPGQLVIYPIFNIQEYGLSVRDYLCALQKSTIAFFNQLGIKTYAKDNSPGIYTSQGKIAFFGIRVKKGTTFHGLSINVTNDTEDFSLIRSCGASTETFDKIASHGVKIPLDQLYSIWTNAFFQELTK
jgi:lipoyl(octanoyl) transferase